ncbi:hypothetical protein TELCIR_09180 [Teladorsagia circumcincta]|uniref:Hexosyltransferase n=1 Tax=Teladorsagia circumcincta TaxID=45464 RepID=A0A2G9UFH1_TELCI|nr:hypothetical protein TELCIR_09180 [Teladorsagia circumcincta]
MMWNWKTKAESRSEKRDLPVKRWYGERLVGDLTRKGNPSKKVEMKALGGNVTSLATDYNPDALECTKETGRLNEVKIEVVRTDLYDGLDHLEISLEIEELLAIEEGRYHDIVVADIREDYYSLSMKTYAMLYFKVHRVPSAKCLVKADSDNVLLIRNYERLCEETRPDVAERLLNASQQSWFPHSANYRKLPEDALFTGIFAEKAGIRRKHVGGMSFIDAPEYICREGKHTYSIHMNRAKDPQRYYRRLTSMEGHPCRI